MKKYVFYFVPTLGYVIEEYCHMLSLHRSCTQYDTPEEANNGIKQLIKQ